MCQDNARESQKRRSDPALFYVRKQFTGYERDDETGLDFAQARYHSYNLGRFSSPDPLMASAQRTNPQSFNRYSYVLNRPLSLIDPSGMSTACPDSDCWRSSSVRSGSCLSRWGNQLSARKYYPHQTRRPMGRTGSESSTTGA